MCCWICCRRDDPSLCMCPGWPWFCIHYPWVEAARTPEFKRGSLLLTSTCILYQPWLYEISYNPIYVSWGVRAKHNTGIILSAGTQRSPVVWTLYAYSLNYSHTSTHIYLNKHNHVRGLYCGLIMTGRCLWCWQVWWSWLLSTEAVSLLTLPDTLLAHHYFYHMLTCYGSSYCMLVTSRLGCWSKVWHCASPSVSQVIIGLEL